VISGLGILFGKKVTNTSMKECLFPLVTNTFKHFPIFWMKIHLFHPTKFSKVIYQTLLVLCGITRLKELTKENDHLPS